MSAIKNKNMWVLIAMTLGLLMASLDNTIVSASIKYLVPDIGGFDKLSWVFTSYMLASTSSMLIFGKLSDIFGRKLLYLIAIVIFLTGSALCGQAETMNEMIAFRVIQGVGAAGLFTISFTLIYTLFSDPKSAAKISGIMGAVFGLSSVFGPQVGEWISKSAALGWRYCFYVNVPLGIVSFLILVFGLKESKSPNKPKVDYVGALLLIATTVSFMLAIEWGGKNYAWGSWQIILLIATAIVGLVLFIMVERKVSEPMLPLGIFKNKIVAGSAIVCMAQGALMFSAITYIPVLAAGVLGYESTSLLLTPMMLSVTCGAILGGFLITKFSIRAILTFMMLAGIIVSILLMNVGPTTEKWKIICIMISLGAFAVGPGMSAIQNAVSLRVEKRYIGSASSVVGFVRNIGGVLGAAIAATLVNNTFKDEITKQAQKLHLGTEQIAVMSSPQALLKGGADLSAETVTFLREALATALNHGFIVGLVAASIGIIAAVLVGKGKAEARAKTDVSH